MNLSNWMLRIGNVRKRANSKKSMEYQIGRVHEEVAEMSMELRRGGDLLRVTYKNDDDGVPKPYGFVAEWGDAVAQLLHIADIVGFDPDEALDRVTSYHEAKRVIPRPQPKKAPTKKKQKKSAKGGQKGKKK